MLGIGLCLLSTCTFAYARNYAIMAITRIPQGAGNALMIVAGKIVPVSFQLVVFALN